VALEIVGGKCKCREGGRGGVGVTSDIKKTEQQTHTNRLSKFSVNILVGDLGWGQHLLLLVLGQSDIKKTK